jgi:hypothetical protein
MARATGLSGGHNRDVRRPEVNVTDGEHVAPEAAGEPRASAISFVTTEHFTLQSARSQTISELTGRASMFLASVSGGLVAWGLVATATRAGGGFYAFGLVLLPTLAFVGLVTFERTLQSGIEDLGYARRIARLRAYYFDKAPELVPYLLSVEPERRLRVQGLMGGYLQGFRTIAGMVGVITAVLVGAEAGLAVIEAFDAPPRRTAAAGESTVRPRSDRGDTIPVGQRLSGSCSPCPSAAGGCCPTFRSAESGGSRIARPRFPATRTL